MSTSSSHFILDSLNEEQRRVVEHTSGPAFILAGAGSGKTRALTHRIANLIHKGVPPWQILAVTFTNKAANEMKERVKNLLHITEESSVTLRYSQPSRVIPSDTSTASVVSRDGAGLTTQGDTAISSQRLPVMGTFHSICVRILRRDIEHLGRDRNFVIYDSDDQEKLMKQVLKELGIGESELKPRPALSYVSRFKSEAVSPAEATAQATSSRMEQVSRAFGRYQILLKESSALDFDDLLLETVRLFHEVPTILDRYQETWRYLHVDEYQDTNHTQYLFITLLAQKYRNLCIIGDPDQSIYGFRGADIRNILEFRKEYPDAIEVKLERNYRSTQTILTAADAVIAANPNRPEKCMWTDRKEGPMILVHEVEDERKEAEDAIGAINEKRQAGVALNEQVILYRTNAQSRLFEEACMRNGLPYRIVGGVKFYARAEVKDILAYLHVFVNPHDTLSMLRILNVPARKIGAVTLGRIQTYATAHRLPLWDALRSIDDIEELEEGHRRRIRDFTEIVTRFIACTTKKSVRSLTVELLETIGMEEWLRDGTEEGEDRWQNVRELLTVMQKYDALTPELSLLSFLEEAALVSEVDKLDELRDDAVTLMTLHLCKGLEFEHVVITGCEEGIFPHSNSLFDREQLEEERRIMYVGMTRAKTHLRLLFARSRMLWGTQQSNAPSRFLDDLPHEVIERRSDDVLSAFAWAAERGEKRATGKVQPYRQEETFDADFNQDTEPTTSVFTEGMRVAHPKFGLGTIVSRHGDILDIAFDGGQRKKFAANIAPLKII